MKRKIVVLLSMFLLFLGIIQIGNSAVKSPLSKKGKKLATLYTYSGTDAFKKVGKSRKWLYKTSDFPEMKIKIYEDGVELKLESIEYRDFGNDKSGFITTGTLFDEKTVKNGVYSFSSILPEGLPYHKLTVRYNGKEIKYILDWGLSIVSDKKTGEPVDELSEIDLYSGDNGDEK